MHWPNTRLNVDRLACPLMRETLPWPYCWVDRRGFMFKVCPSKPVNRVEKNECAQSCGLGHCARRELKTMVFSVSTATPGQDLLPPRPPRPFAPQKSQTSQASSRRTDRAEYGALNTAQSGFRIETRKLHHRCPAGYSRTVQHCIWVRMPPPTFESVVSSASKMAGSALLWYGDPHSLAQ